MDVKRKWLVPLLSILLVLASLSVWGYSASDPELDLKDWRLRGSLEPLKNTIAINGQFNGYLNYWTNDYWQWVRYGNLFQMGAPLPGAGYRAEQARPG